MSRALHRILLAAGVAAVAFACQTPSAPLAVVEELDLARYAGDWYEIASLPQRFQRGCVGTRATYMPLEDGRIRVVNSCRNGHLDGELRRVEGVAWRADPDGADGKLEVQFFWPFRGDYWILDLDPDYRWAVVGHPSRRYLWILSRSPQMDQDLFSQITARARAKGYSLEGLTRTPQALDGAF